MTDFEEEEGLRAAFQDLREDAALLRLALLGARVSTDRLTLDCLLRLSDYLDQHVDDLRVSCGL
ncbi:MAG: hypothetical protein ACI4OU_02355 [Candidatus Enterenecus sp.]